MASTTETTVETLSLLEDRLRRVAFVLHGRADERDEGTTADSTEASAIARLRNLEQSLQALAASSTAVGDVLALHTKHPELFHAPDSTHVSSTPAPSSLASLILAHSQLYQSLASKLSQLQSSSIPDVASATKLIQLRPRIEAMRAKQSAQTQELADLRVRSARAVETWYEGGVLRMGDRWADWEERLRAAEITLRRREAAKKREEGAV